MDQFDPDKLYLTKAQLNAIGDKLIAGWTRTGKAGNQKMIWITKFAKWLVMREKAQDIEQYYRDFLREAFEVMYNNQLTGLPELSVLKKVSKERTITSELDFRLAKMIPHWPGLGVDDD